jgi:MFS family permease
MQRTISSRNIALYFACQALAASSASLLAATSAIVGAMLAPDARMATVPAALQQLATFVTTYPASYLMVRLGRRAGFSLGAALGVLGGAAATLGVIEQSFLVFCVGIALTGGHAGFATFYRFAAVESAPPQRRERALGWVMSAGVLAAFLGPWLARRTRDTESAFVGSFGGSFGGSFVGSFVALCAMALLSVALLQMLGATAAPSTSARPRAAPRDLLRKPPFLTFAAAGMVSGATMVFVMGATPLAMAGCHHGFDSTAHVIQWHVLAMFAPSFVTGRLVARFGATQTVLGGLLLCASAAVVNASGTSVTHFQIGLVLLGLGWNLAFLGVTTAIARMAPEDQPAAQGLNDLLVFCAVAIASLLAGVVEHTAGWRVLNLAVLPPLGLAGVALARRHVTPVPPQLAGRLPR